MKRITTIFMFLMLVCMGAGALTPVTSITSGKAYYFYNSRFGQYINTSLQTDACLFNGIKFTLTESDGNYNIYSADKGGYLTWGTLSDGIAPTISAETSENTLWTIDVQSGTIMNIYPKGQTNKELISQSTNAGKDIVLYGWDNQGGQWYIYEADDFEEEYAHADLNRAVSAITSGNQYRIFTEFGNSNTKYYLKDDGTLTASEVEACYFTFTATTGTYYAPAGKAWRITSTPGKYFTNGSQSDGVAVFRGSINTTTGQNRDTFEGQVLFLNASGKYAIRSTNNRNNSGYADNSYWMVDDTNDDGVPEAGYCTTLEEKHYDWQLEAPSGYITYNLYYNGEKLATNDDVPKVLGAASASLPYGWNCAYCNLSYSPSTIEASTKSVDVTLTWDGPFEISSGFDGATWYYVYFNRANGKKYWQMDPNTTPYPDKTSKPSVSEALWAFTGNPYDGIKVMNARAGDGKYLKKTGSSSGNAITMQEGGDTWVIGTGDGGFTLKEDGTYVFIHDYSTQLAVWNNTAAATDKGSAIVVEDAAPVKVTYKLTYNGNVISSYTKDLYELVGATAAAPYDWELPAYCSFGSCTPATITAETTEVTIPLNWNGPFDFSTDYAHAKWYYLGINRSTADNPEYCVYSASTPYQLVSLEDAQSAGYNGIWAFVGNPYDGVRIVNHGSGEGYYLNLSNYPSMVNATYPTYSLLRIKAHTNGAGFTLDNDDYYLCNYNTGDGGLRIFAAASAAYHQTCITVSAVPYKTLELLDLEAYANSHALGQYFGVDETAYNNTVVAVNAQETVTESDYNTFSSMMSGYMNPRLPESGYYRIKSSGSRGRTSYITYGKLSDEKGIGLLTTANDKNGDYGTVIKLTRVGSSKNYKISVQGLNVQVHSGDNTLFTATESAAPSFAFNHISLSGKCSINDGSTTHGYLHEANWYNSTTGLNGVVGWDEGDGSNASTWSLEDVSTISVTMNDGGDDHTYATLYLPFGVTIDSGSDVDAYIMTIDGDVAIGTNIGKDIPANTGVILKGTDASVTLTINDDATATTTENDLEGTCVVKDAREGDEGVYDLVLGKGTTSNTLGFYLAPEGRKLAANKAYLPYRPAAAGARVNGFAIQWDDETTGIRSIDNGKQSVKNGAIYDLQGRKVANPSRGMYIINGRVVVVK